MPAMLAGARGWMKQNGRVERHTDTGQLVSHMKGVADDYRLRQAS
jgi:hypothetical protein